MAGYYGTEQQQALQRRTHEMRDWIAATPGIYNAGRFMGVEDPDRVPPHVIETILARDGMLGLRMISPAQAATWFPKLQGMGYRIDTWDILVGSAQHAGERAAAVIAEGMPAAIDVLPRLAGAEAPETRVAQRFLAENGLAPFSGAMLSASPPQARTVMLGGGDLAAIGHAYFPHNEHSPFRAYAWVGLIAVAEAQRGKGLGRLVNALLVKAAIEELGASHVYEMVGRQNLASRRMVEACGLSVAADVLCGVAMPAATDRFTR